MQTFLRIVYPICDTDAGWQAAINDACTSAMFASLDMSRSTLDAIDEYRHVALALIGEIETRAAKRAGQRGKGIKREEGDADLDGGLAHDELENRHSRD